MGGDGSDALSAADDLERFAMDLYFEVFQALVTLINRQVDGNWQDVRTNKCSLTLLKTGLSSYSY